MDHGQVYRARKQCGYTQVPNLYFIWHNKMSYHPLSPITTLELNRFKWGQFQTLRLIVCLFSHLYLSTLHNHRYNRRRKSSARRRRLLSARILKADLDSRGPLVQNSEYEAGRRVQFRYRDTCHQEFNWKRCRRLQIKLFCRETNAQLGKWAYLYR